MLYIFPFNNSRSDLHLLQQPRPIVPEPILDHIHMHDLDHAIRPIVRRHRPRFLLLFVPEERVAGVAGVGWRGGVWDVEVILNEDRQLSNICD